MDIVARVAAFLAACACISINSYTQGPDKIGSTSLCGDAYLQALSPDGLAALSWQSRDPISRASPAQKQLPQIWDDPEVLVSSGLNHIVFGPFEGQKSKNFLPKQVTTTELQWGEGFETLFTNMKLLAEDLSVPTDASIDDMNSRLEKLSIPESAPFILYMARDGSSSGPGTFVDAVITRAGGQNILTSPGWQKPDLEFLLALEPDLIVTSYFQDGYSSVNATPIRHQALRNYISKFETVEIPGTLWPCAGPGLVEAAEILNAKIETLQ